MSPKQLENAIRFRAQEALPIAIDDAVLDYQVLSQSVNAEGELVHRVLLVVAYRDLVDRYVEACKKAGIRLVGIDLEAFALLRALVVPTPADVRPDAAQVVVSVGHDRSTFAVSDGTICEFTRVLDWGGSALDIAIARQLNLTPSDAEPIKWAVALDNTERELPEGITADASRRPPRSSAASCRRSRASSSPRSSSTRTSPDRSASARSSSRAERPRCRASRRSCSG